MRTSITLMFVVFIIILIPAYAQQESLIEKVEVDWWVIPVFALDGSGRSITDLSEADIELLVDGKKVDNIVLLKKDFSAPEQETEPEQPVQPVQPKPALERQKNVFLIFDTALSTKDSTEKAKAIARKIVADAEPNTRFFIMTIVPFSGLVYAGGQTNDKAVLNSIISQNVIPRENIRVPSYKEIVEDVEGKQSKYDESDLGFFRMEASKYHVRKSISFVQSFEALYYALKSIKDNKFVYLFSEGVSHALQTADTGNETMYRRYLSQMSDYLGRCGAVLFIINPFGSVTPGEMEDSGEESLRFMAKESGGKYVEGTETSVLDVIDSFHKAYYEIFFPALPQSREGILKITVIAKRNGIAVHTLRTAEKNRAYAQMDAVEREVTALNIISGNPLYESGLAAQPIDIADTTTKKDTLTYRVAIPDRFAGQALDVYKVRMNKEGKDTVVEKESLRSAPRDLKITFKKVKEGQDTYFVLVNSRDNSALVHGLKKPDQHTYLAALPPDSQEWATKELMSREKQAMKADEARNLEMLLKGAADYCEKLKTAAFHYICKEKIAETQEPFSRTRGHNEDDLSFSEPQDEYLYNRVVDNDQQSARDVSRTTIERRVFNYRLIKSGEQVKEERDLLKDEEDGAKKKDKGKEEQLTTQEAVRRIRFLSSKAVFGPITLLAADRQDKYDFRLVGSGELQGRPVAIIEALPKKESDASFIYGKIWIDAGNFSILKIKANPNSIVGYGRLKKFADQLTTKLDLELETDFFKFRDGISFPTSIRFEETYKGGPLVTSRRGSKGWTRTLTLTEYTDYMFFDVKTDVTIEKGQ